jgi:glutathione S-transferase
MLSVIGMAPLDRFTSMLASVVRFGSGRRVIGSRQAPDKRLILYEMENCPYSRKVREALTLLGLDVEIRPCPEGDRHHRPDLVRLTGKEQLPLLLDPNTGSTLHDSDRIVQYLFDTYGEGARPPMTIRGGRIGNLSSRLASKIRRDRGTEAAPARRPRQPLELWGFEGSPETRRVREELSRFALPYVARNAARGSGIKRKLERRRDIPLLIDPNTDARREGADAARQYLAETYGLEEPESQRMPVPRPAPREA